MQEAQWGQPRFSGQNQIPKWDIRNSGHITAIATWHEFGHAWGFIHKRFDGASNPDALKWENAARATRFGKEGPTNAFRIVH